MTNEELEQKVKRLEEQLTEVRIELLERKVNKTSYEVEVPEDIGDYYFVSELGVITLLKDVFFSAGYEKVYQRGLAFKTKEEAEQFDKERILINKLKNWAKEHQEDWTPDWKNRGTKYHISYEMEQGFFNIEYCVCYNPFTKLPFFKSEKIAKKFIEEFGKEIKEVLYNGSNNRIF
jgi:hypothetical protein